jgi:transcriptional regulator with XRE-family HTH domain
LVGSSFRLARGSCHLSFDRHRLIGVRKVKGLKPADVARASGVSESAISRYESGARRPGIDELIGIVAALELSVDYVLGIDDRFEGESFMAIAAHLSLERFARRLGLRDPQLAELESIASEHQAPPLTVAAWEALVESMTIARQSNSFSAGATTDRMSGHRKQPHTRARRSH